jgi:hypothetical protein
MNPKINVIWTSTCPASDLGVLDLLESTAATLFLTGHADSGKTTFVRYWRAITGETVAVLVPTGITRRFRVLAGSVRRSHPSASATTDRRGVTGPRQHGAGHHDSAGLGVAGFAQRDLSWIMASHLTFCFAGL